MRALAIGGGASISLPVGPSVGIWYGAGWTVLIENLPWSSVTTTPRRLPSGRCGAKPE
jgi:hypothetical protein